jgi:hypothetical protein
MTGVFAQSHAQSTVNYVTPTTQFARLYTFYVCLMLSTISPRTPDEFLHRDDALYLLNRRMIAQLALSMAPDLRTENDDKPKAASKAGRDAVNSVFFWQQS